MRVTLGLVTMLLLTAPVAADEGDGLYGRLDGDLTLSLAAGGGMIAGGDETAAVLGELRLRYVESAGLLVAGELHPGGAQRAVFALDFRPVFLWHFFTDRWSGVRFTDLLLDSIGMDLGVAVLRHGVALAIGFGLDVPIWWGDDGSPGLFLRLGARHVRASANERYAPDGGASDWLLHAALGIRDVVDAGIAGGRASRYRTED